MNGQRHDFYLSEQHRNRDKAWEWGVGAVFGVGVVVILAVFVVPVL